MSRLKKEILNKLKEYAGKMGKDHLGGDDIASPKRGGLRDFDGYDNVQYNKDMPMDEMQVVNKKTGKDITKHVLALLSGKIDKKKFEKLTGLKKESVNEAKSEKDFKLGTPAVFDGDRGEVITNPKTQRAWTPNGWGTVKKGVRGIMVYGSNSFIVPDWSKTKKFNESVNEGKVDRVVGHSRYKYVGDGRKGQAIVSGPMKDREKEAIIKRAKKAGYNAKPNMGGGVTIHVESLEVNEIGQFPINNYIQGIIPTGYLDTNTPQKKKQSVKLVSDLKKTLNTFWKQHDIPYRIK